MKAFKKLLVITLIASMLSGFFPYTLQNVFAVATPVNVYIDSFSYGKLKFHWDKPIGAKSFRISYHTPQNSLESEISNEDTNTHLIEGLENDYIYDIRVEMYNDLDAGGSKIAEGIIYFLPRISFYASRVEQERKPIPGGGYETGDEPRLSLKWTMPRVWNQTSGEVAFANEANSIDTIKNSLNSVYNNGLDITSLNFKINISSSISTLNSGSSQSSISVDFGDDGYKAYVSGNQETTSGVAGPDANRFMSFDLIGRKDISMPLPATEEFGLPDGDIIPGTVYYMNIKLAFNNDSGDTKYAVTVGKPSDLNGSVLSGAYSYTYTPIRFQLSKDAADNIYIKMFKVNQGSLDLPRMFYEIQSSDDPTIPGDWTVKKTVDDSFFTPGAESAITLISGVGVNNKIYYKIIVKTDTTSDRIESPSMHYTLTEDTNKSPVPKGITVIDRTLVKRTVLENNEDKIQKSSDVTISWEKPSNWDEIRANTDPDKDITFHLLLNTSQVQMNTEPYPELKADGVVYGYFPLKYRCVIYFSSKAVKENGNRLEYTIKGFELFNGKYFSGMDATGQPIIVDEEIENPEGYTDFLLPNKVYYMQMYTTNAANRNSTELEDMSDRSVIVSFTTRATEEVDVPLPKNFRLSRNDADVTIGETTVISNYIEFQFDKVSVNWKNFDSAINASNRIYYDVYMSTRTDINTFRLIGSTEELKGDLTFVGADDEQSTSVKVVVRNFSKGTDANAAFGSELRPNTTYYFIAKTRLSIEGQENDKISDPTAPLSVTTVKGVIGTPDDSSKRPLAPTDFGIADDEDGNLILTGSKVVFTWIREETEVAYNIICTSRRLDAEEGSYSGAEDALFQSFNATFGEIVLDPSLEEFPENFDYNPLSRVCTYTIDKWLFPNKLYYFSIKAVKKTDSSSFSSWVSIPVTTSLIEQPTFVEAIGNVQLGFSFSDEDINAKTEDYSINIKAENDLKYRKLTQDKYTIAKFGATCYVRIANLKADTYYDVKVNKDNDETLVYIKENMTTRDSYHEIEVKWRGIPEYKFELTIKNEKDDNYTVLSAQDFEQYTDENGKILPYYREKNAKTSGSDYEYFYARIKSIPVKHLDGSIEHVPLDSNTKYYIKVRTVKVDPVDPAIVAYSKYSDTVNIRTDFNQKDYDEEDMDTKKEASFLDKIEKLEKSTYWRVGLGDENSSKILLKADRIVNAIMNNGRYSFELDISRIAQGVCENVIYIPEDIISSLESGNKSLVIRTEGAEYTLRPGTIDLQSREIKELKDKQNVNDIIFKVKISRLEKPSKPLPDGFSAVSRISGFEVSALGTSLTYAQLKGQIDDLLYNKESGLLQEKLTDILTANEGIKTSKQLETLLEKSTNDIESKLSEFIKSKLEGKNSTYPIVASSQRINEFKNPIMTKIFFEDKEGLKLPYVCYSGDKEWRKVSAGTVYISNSTVFNAVRAGEYSVLLMEITSEGFAGDYTLPEDMKILMSAYDLADVFGSLESFYPDDTVNVKEIVLLYEKVIGREFESTGLNVKQKAEKYGLGSLIGLGGVLKEVNRQETAKVVMMVYSYRTGVNVMNMVPGKYPYISDADDIGDQNYKFVIMAVDMDLLRLDGNSAFLPQRGITREQLASVFVKVLRITGSI